MRNTNPDDSKCENLSELVDELQAKLKRKHTQLISTRQKLSNARQTIQRLQLAVSFQRERILDLRRMDAPRT